MYKIKDIKDKILQGDVIDELKKIPNETIDTVITSPSYYGLRDYSTLYDKSFPTKKEAQQWIKEQKNKDYFSKIREIQNLNGEIISYKAIIYSKFIKKNQVGLEETPQDYINKMVDVARNIKRVLKKSGSFWINIADSYWTKSGSGKNYGNLQNQQEDEYGVSEHRHTKRGTGKYPSKCLCMIPERLAIAMIDDGWILRNKIIWSKQVMIHKTNSTIGNVMPTSVNDRFNTAYEYLFFFTKNKKYYFNLDSVRIPHQTQSLERYQRGVNLGVVQTQGKMFEDKVDKPMQPPKVFREQFGKDKNYKGKFDGYGIESENYGSPRARNARIPRGGLVPGNTSQARPEHDVRRCGRGGNNKELGNRNFMPTQKTNKDINSSICNIQGKNICDVWQVNTRPSSIKHFALFPVALLSRPIKTCLPHKICKKCGHIVTTKSKKEGTPIYTEQGKPEGIERSKIKWGKSHPNHNPRWWNTNKVIGENKCKCKNIEYEGGIVLDPFFGGGTTAIAQRLYCSSGSFIGIEINSEYVKLAEKRIKEESPEQLGI